MAQHEAGYGRYSRYAAAGGPGPAAPGIPLSRGGLAECNFGGFGMGTGRFGELTRPEGAYARGVVFDDNKIISEQHYHHGDHHHHHHQRHLHHFHDLHLIQEATETMDLRNVPEVCTRVIPSETGPMEMRLRPDLIGKTIFDNGADQYGFGVQYRMDDGPVAGGVPALGYQGYQYNAAAAAAAQASSSAAYSYGGYPAYGGRGVVDEELYHRRVSH